MTGVPHESTEAQGEDSKGQVGTKGFAPQKAANTTGRQQQEDDAGQYSSSREQDPAEILSLDF